MRFEFTILVEVEREQGKFATREEIGEQILETLEAADPGQVDGIGADGDSVYTTITWDVTSKP